MAETIFFVYVISDAGHWLGKVKEAAYNDWKSGKALLVNDGRGLHFNSDPRAGTVSVTIGPLYIGDTKQVKVAVFPTSVEIIGEVEDDGRSCTENNGLYVQYIEAIDKWKAALAGITLSNAADLSKIDNITNFPGNK